MQIRLISLRLCVVLGLLCVAFARLAMGQSCPPQWTTSGGVPSVNGEVLCSTTLASGAVVVGGTFTEAGGVAASNVAKYDPATRTWSALGTGLSFATVRAVTGLPNGDIIAGGSFFSASGTSFNNIARYSAATSTWVPIVVGGQTGLPAQVNALQGLADGSLVVGGDFLQSTSQPGRYVTILNPAGSAWSALGTGVNASVTGLGVLQSGEILVLGNFTTAGANTSGRVARFNRTSGVWNVLGNWQSGLLYCATQLPGGDVVVGGSFSDAGGTFARNIARYSFASNTWTDLSSGVDNAVYGVVYRAATNDLVVGGSFGNYLPGFTARRIARYSLTDNAWSAIGDGIVGTGVNAISPIASGRVFVGGSFFSAADAAVENCVTLDGANNFVPTGRTTSAAVRTAIDVGNDTLIVGGAFSHANGVRVSRIGRYNAATGAWSSMGAGLSRTTFGLFPTVHAVAQLANGDIIAGGDFVESGAEVVNRIARFRSATGQWEPIGSGTLGTVLALLPLPGSSFLAAGSFNTIGDVSSPAVARFNSGTGSWEPFGSGMPAGVTVRAMVRLTNGDVIATGSGTTALRRYSAATDQWSAVGTISNGFSDSVDSLLLLPTGRVVVGGFFTSIGGLATRNVAVFDPTNSTWSTLGAANAVSGGNVLSLVLDADGNVVLAGSFTQAGGVAANGVARFNVASSTWQTFAPGVQGGNGVAKVVRLSTSPDLFLFGSFLKLGDAAPSTPAAFIARVASGGTSPVITAQPVNRTVCPGPVSFVVTATGTPAPTYRWRRNGVPMNIATNPSAATSTLAFSNAGESDNGNYDCVVTNACGSVTSQVGRLTVCRADYDCSGGVDSDDVIEFFGDWDVSNSSADFNGDGGVDADDVIGFFARWDGGC